jgi:uncharacterized protein (DUF433 family)
VGAHFSWAFAEYTDMDRLSEAIYRPDVDRRDLPVYTPADAASYLGISRSTLDTWIYGRYYEIAQGKAFFPPLIKPADEEHRLLSFFNLAEAHILAATRYEHNVSIKSIRAALGKMNDMYGDIEHPLLQKEFFTNGKDIFIKSIEDEENINLSTPGQLNFKPIMDLFLKHIELDDAFKPHRVYPIIKGQPADKVISIVPGVSSGRPIIDGTGIPVWVLHDRYSAGEPVTSIADDFELPAEKVQRAIDYVEKRAA